MRSGGTLSSYEELPVMERLGEGSGFEPPVPQMHLVEQLFGAGIDQVLGGPISSGGMMMRS